MNNNTKGIELLKQINQIEEDHFNKALFCSEHNMELDKIKHREIMNEVRKIGQIIKKTLDLPSIPS